MSGTTIREQYDMECGQRTAVLDIARRCAKLTKPWVLQPEGQTQDTELPSNFQSIGSRGITNLEGKMVMALWPASLPWFELVPSADIRYNPDYPPEKLQEIEQTLWLVELLIQAKLEAAVNGSSNRRPIGFRTQKRAALSQILVTGETLERLNEDFTLTVFGREQYTVVRDTQGNILSICTEEEKDPLSLAPKQFEATKLVREDIEKLPVSQRMKKLYTRVQWVPKPTDEDADQGVWRIEQEVNDQIINKSEEPVCQYFSTPFELPAKSNYGRGFAELNRGDLHSCDSLNRSALEFAALCAKVHPIFDPSSMLKPDDLKRKKSGDPLVDFVQNNQPSKLGFLKVDKLNDFSAVQTTKRDVEVRLAKAMLLDTDSVRDSERTTALEVRTTILELEGALGGFYAPVADQQQVPLIQRVLYMLQRDNLVPKLPDKSVEIRALTGIAALARQQASGRLTQLIQQVAALGPEAIAQFNKDVIVDLLVRYANVYEPGLKKTKEQADAELQKAIAAQTQLAAAQKGVDVVGNIAESALTPGTT